MRVMCWMAWAVFFGATWTLNEVFLGTVRLNQKGGNLGKDFVFYSWWHVSVIATKEKRDCCVFWAGVKPGPDPVVRQMSAVLTNPSLAVEFCTFEHSQNSVYVYVQA